MKRFFQLAALSALAACSVEEKSLDEAVGNSIRELAVAPSGGCTRPASYWKAHHQYAVLPSNQIPWPMDENLMICRRSILSWIETAPVPGDAWHNLARHVIVTTLNVRSGASAPANVVSALDRARIMISSSCTIAAADLPRVWPLMATLDDYNTGVVGPGTCAP